MNKTAFIPVYKRKLDSEHWFGFENIETDNIVLVIFQNRSHYSLIQLNRFKLFNLEFFGATICVAIIVFE